MAKLWIAHGVFWLALMAYVYVAWIVSGDFKVTVTDENGNVELVPVLHVDGTTITHDAKDLAKIKVTAEVVGDLRGPKIVIQKFKNKTGYKKRQGHRQELTRVKITSIA